MSGTEYGALILTRAEQELAIQKPKILKIMKKFFLFLSLVCWHLASVAQDFTPALEFVMQLRVKIGQVDRVGETPHGSRQSIAITGGTFKGPRIEGEVLAGGADYQLSNGQRTEVEAIYNIRTNDGVTIHVRNQGLITQSQDGFYFYTNPHFEAPMDSKYAWLNNNIFVCRINNNSGFTGGVALDVWRVCDPDNYEETVGKVEPIPEAIWKPAEKKGKIEEFHYTAVRNGQKMDKRAQVYVPYGYNPKDKKTRYNVVYLMHGGGDNTTSFLTPPNDWLPLAQVLDHLIEDGKMAPVLVVCPTFYNDDKNIGANRMDDATKQCRDFHIELQNYLIPTVELKYNTYLQGKTDSIAIAKTREHRAFGGFSMGALCTWYQLAYGISAVRNYLPLSGDIWTYDAEGKKQDAYKSAEWMNQQVSTSGYGDDFQVYGYSGTKDMAGDPEKKVIGELRQFAPTFRYGGPNENIRFSMKEGGQHFYGDINQYLYYAFPLIWK